MPNFLAYRLNHCVMVFHIGVSSVSPTRLSHQVSNAHPRSGRVRAPSVLLALRHPPFVADATIRSSYSPNTPRCRRYITIDRSEASMLRRRLRLLQITFQECPRYGRSVIAARSLVSALLRRRDHPLSTCRERPHLRVVAFASYLGCCSVVDADHSAVFIAFSALEPIQPPSPQ